MVEGKDFVVNYQIINNGNGIASNIEITDKYDPNSFETISNIDTDGQVLYSLDELIDPSVTLKIIGHQWYWSYEYSDYSNIYDNESLNFDSYMISTSDLTLGSFRLLEVDNRIVLPINTHIRVLITAADVLHSWAIPSFGIKVDACPGRLSQCSLFIKRSGLFFGQCSEICGINHGFMPIAIKSVPADTFISWITTKLENN